MLVYFIFMPWSVDVLAGQCAVALPELGWRDNNNKKEQEQEQYTLFIPAGK